MQIDPAFRTHVETTFSPLNRQAAAHSFPQVAALSTELAALVPAKSTDHASVNVQPELSAMFATASVDMWMRAVHSFLVSASLTNVSDIWASVTGYYSSHYSVRAFAHLLGYFQLYTGKRIVHLQLLTGRHVCTFDPKTKWDREHLFYWRIVKQNPLFVSDPLFTNNNKGGKVPSDVEHRERANYADHLPNFPTFRPLDAAALKNRVQRISEIQFSTPPIPRVEGYPDVESVQVVAYHRLVRFRDLVNNILGDSNRFWKTHRNPSWANDFMDYQLTEQATLRSQYK